MGFTQRQAGGKFTRDEAEGFIAQLQEAAESPADDRPDVPAPASPPRQSATERTLRAMPADLLAAELQRRGWGVIDP
jgi:hypothetical protein